MRAVFQLCAMAICLSTFTMSYAQTSGDNAELSTPTIEPQKAPVSDDLESLTTWVFNPTDHTKSSDNTTLSEKTRTHKETLKLVDAEGERLTITCHLPSEENLYYKHNKVTFGFTPIEHKPVNEKAFQPVTKDTFKELRAILTIDRRAVRANFLKLRGSPQYAGLQARTARQVFNAAVRGQKVSISYRKQVLFEAALPKPNQDFREFVKACPSLQPKKK